MYFCDGIAEFSADITPIFGVSFRTKICWFGDQEIFIIINVKNGSDP